MELTKWVKIRRQTFVKGELALVDDVVAVDDSDFYQLTSGTQKAIPWHDPKIRKKIEPKPDKMTATKAENREENLVSKIVKRGRAKKVKGKKV